MSPTNDSPTSSTPPPTSTSPAPNAARLLYRFRWLLILATIVGTIGGYVWARMQPEYFEATINCVPPRVDPSSQLGGIGGIASTLKDVGLTKLAGKSGSSYELMALLFSRSLRDSLIVRFNLVQEYELEGQKYEAVLDEIEKNIDIALRAEGNYEITIASRDTSKCVAMCHAFVEMANNMASQLTQKEAERATSYLERRIALLDSTIDVLSQALGSKASNTLMFAPEQQFSAIATTFADLQGELLKQETVLGLYQRLYGAGDQQTMLQEQVVAKLKSQVQNLKSQPGYFGDFTLRDAAQLGIPMVRLQAEIEAMGKVKAFLVPTLEQSRLDSQNATLSLMIVDIPRRPETRSRPKRMLVGLGTGVGTFAGAVALLFCSAAWSDIRRRMHSA